LISVQRDIEKIKLALWKWNGMMRLLIEKEEQSSENGTALKVVQN